MGDSRGWFARIFWATATVLLASVVVREIRLDDINSRVRIRNFYGTLHVTERYNTAKVQFDADQATCQKYAAVQNISRGGRC